MERILAISDIHGCYDQFIDLLEIVQYNSTKDKLIILGDYCDRGLKSKEVIEKCIELKEKGVITLKGNHCELFLNWLLTEDYSHKEIFLHNGGLATIESYMGRDWIEQGLTHENYQSAKHFIIDNYTEHIKFLIHNDYYHEVDNHVFVHAGIDPTFDDWKDTHPDDFIWIRKEFLDVDHNHDVTFIFGHTPTQFMHNNKNNNIYFGNKKIGIDGGCFSTGQLNCLEIKDGKYKQYNT